MLWVMEGDGGCPKLTLGPQGNSAPSTSPGTLSLALLLIMVRSGLSMTKQGMPVTPNI